MTLKNWFYLISLSMLWGSSYVFIEFALISFSPLAIVFWRCFIAGLLLLILLKIKGYKLPNWRSWHNFIILSFLSNVIPFLLIVWGQTHINSSVAAVLNATTPMFTVVLAHFLIAEKLTWIKALALLIGFIGVYIMFKDGLNDGFSWTNIGQLAVLLASVSYSFASIWGKRLQKYYFLVVACCMLLSSSVILLPFLLVFELPIITLPTLIPLLSVLAIAIFGTFLAYPLYFLILNSSGPSTVVLVTFLVPISATSLAILFLDEVLTSSFLLGLLVIFSSLLIINWSFFKNNFKINNQ